MYATAHFGKRGWREASLLLLLSPNDGVLTMFNWLALFDQLREALLDLFGESAVSHS